MACGAHLEHNISLDAFPGCGQVGVEKREHVPQFILSFKASIIEKLSQVCLSETGMLCWAQVLPSVKLVQFVQFVASLIGITIDFFVYTKLESPCLRSNLNNCISDIYI